MIVLLAAAATLLPSLQLSISTSQIDITPTERLPLGGYTERGNKLSEPVGDPLYARTVLFISSLRGSSDRPNPKIAMVSVETLTIPESLVREVKKRIPSDVSLFLAATHTHSAPDSQMLNDRMTFAIPGIASFQSKWLTWYADKIAKGINDALDSLKESPQVIDLAIREGHADENVGRRKFADPDQTATLLYEDVSYPPDILVAPESKLLMLQYAAHGTVYDSFEMHTRGDWPGVAAEKFGCEVLQGAIGDVLPNEVVRGGNELYEKIESLPGTVKKPTPEESIEEIVRGLAHATLDKTPRVVWRPGQPVSVVSNPIALDPVKPHPTMAKSYGVPEVFAENIVKQFAPTSASITAIRLGKLAIIGVPGEPTSILGRQIKDAGRRMGFDSVLVCSHVNGWMGYILDPEDYDRGGYEATLSFYGREEGAKVVEAGIEALKRLCGM